jgi:hypothetical protein
MVVSFAMFADGANISQEGKLNILGVFDAVQVGGLPAVHPRAHLIVRLKGTPQDAGTHQVSLRWINPGGVELWASDGQVELAPAPPGVAEVDIPLIASIDLPLDLAGAYVMRVVVNGQQRGEISLHVRSAPPAFVAAPPASAMLS